MLELSSVRAGYGTFQALFDVSLQVRQGEAVAVIGPNGAGKTTLMRVVSGMIRPTAGAISMEGVDLVTTPAHRIIELGMAHVPESRRLFASMTVEENLKMGGFMAAARPKFRQRLDFVYELFPRLRERRRQRAGSMSGGEQQMCAIGRALMARPKLLLLDEPSMGLAPIFVDRIFETILEVNKAGTPVLLVEQNALMALDVAKRAYVMETGRIALEGPASELKTNEQVRATYLGEG